MDITLIGGWHVTIFHPWAWLVLAVLTALLCGSVLKLVPARVVSG